MHIHACIISNRLVLVYGFVCALYSHIQTQSLQAVIRSSLACGGVHASDVAMLEMHGTGTPLGDPIVSDLFKGFLGRVPK